MMKLTDPQAKALAILEPAGIKGMRPIDFAREMWPDSTTWNRGEKSGAGRYQMHSVQRGVSGRMNAGKLLWRLVTKGLVGRHGYAFYLTEPGRRALRERANGPNLTGTDQGGP